MRIPVLVDITRVNISIINPTENGWEVVLQKDGKAELFKTERGYMVFKGTFDNTTLAIKAAVGWI
jgi:hypothetical protein